EGTRGVAALDFRHGFLEARIDHAPLLRRVFVVSIWKFGNDRDHAPGGLHFEIRPALKTSPPQRGRRDDNGGVVFDGNGHTGKYTSVNSVSFYWTPSRYPDLRVPSRTL